MSCTGPSKVGDQAANFGENFGIGILNIFGLGGIVSQFAKTPYDQLKSQLEDIQDTTRKFQDQANIALWQKQIKLDSDLFRLIQLSNQDLTASINEIDELLKEDISLNKVYILFLYLLFLVIYFYLMLK